MSEQKKVIVLGAGASMFPELRAGLEAAAGHGLAVVAGDDTSAVMAILGDRIDQDEKARKAVQDALDSILKNHALDRPRLLFDRERAFLIAANVAAHEQDQLNDKSYIASAVEYGQDPLRDVPDTELLFRSLIAARGLNQMNDTDRHQALLMLASAPGVLPALISECTSQDLCTLMEDVNDAVADMPDPFRLSATMFAKAIAAAVHEANTVAEPSEDDHPAP